MDRWTAKAVKALALVVGASLLLTYGVLGFMVLAYLAGPFPGVVVGLVALGGFYWWTVHRG